MQFPASPFCAFLVVILLLILYVRAPCKNMSFRRGKKSFAAEKVNV